MITEQMINSLNTANWTRADYDACTHLNQSAGKLLLVSPAHFRDYLDSPRKETAALRMGTLVHMATLEPEVFTLQLMTIPEDAPKKPTDKQRNAKKPKPETLEAIAWWDNFNEQAKGKTLVDADEQAAALKMGLALSAELKHWGVKAMAKELSLTCTYDGIALKGQLDLVSEDGWIYDLKTFEKRLSKYTVRSSVYKYGYAYQAAYYCLLFKQVFGVRAKGFRMVCVEKQSPHATGIYEIGGEMLADGMVQVAQTFETYKACTAFNSWPAYPKEIITLEPYRDKEEVDAITFA
jgi:exodeoxyribonuclease VIII